MCAVLPNLLFVLGSAILRASKRNAAIVATRNKCVNSFFLPKNGMNDHNKVYNKIA